MRKATLDDAAAMARIYSQGIEERIATFETHPRSAEEVATWFEHTLPKIVIEQNREVIAFAVTFPYSDRCCYSGVAEFSVYVDRETRRIGAGKRAMQCLIEAAKESGLHKLLSRVFPENIPSRALLASLGFREVGTHEKHAKLDNRWKDVIAVEYVIEENL